MTTKPVNIMLTIDQFLQDIPVYKPKLITELSIKKIDTYATITTSGPFFHCLRIPFDDILINCPSDICNGKRTFRCLNDKETPELYSKYDFYFIEYECKNCEEYTKTYALAIKLDDENNGTCEVIKVGEWPEFGPRTPSRFIKLIGPDKELFLKGRQAENIGLGIGSFTYYRRVVENQKNRLIDKIINVAKKTDYSQKSIAILEKAKEEDQFSKSIDLIKDNIPRQLFIDGHNPLTQIHKALSVGIHELEDEECLEYATSIRTVLFELSSSISTVLKERSALKSAIGILNRSKK